MVFSDFLLHPMRIRPMSVEEKKRPYVFRVKRTGSYAYLQIVESFREQGQVHQRC